MSIVLMVSDEEAALHRSIIRTCEAIGYGRVMQIASDAWAGKDPIGAITLGPCLGTLNRPPRQALTYHGHVGCSETDVIREATLLAENTLRHRYMSVATDAQGRRFAVRVEVTLEPCQ